jgi:pilus assembly protein CpaB
MRANSIIMLVLALVFGTIAVFLTQSWLQSQASLASRGPAQQAVEVQTIVVAARPLRFGMQVKPDNLKEIPWPGGSIPEGGFGKISDLVTKEGERFVLSAIEPNEPIYKWKVTGPGARATLSAVVDDGMRAVAIQINDVLGVAGFVLPGDRVDIMLTRNNRGEGTITDIMLQNVKVLAINQLADDRTNKPITARTVTVEVDTFDAQKLALASRVGTLSLALRSAGSVDAAQPRRASLNDLNPANELYSEDEQGAADGKQPAIRDKAVEAKFKSVEEQLQRMNELMAKANKRQIDSLGDPSKPRIAPVDPNAKVGIIRGMKQEIYRVPRDENLRQ